MFATLLFIAILIPLGVLGGRATLDVSRPSDATKFSVTNFGTRELPQTMFCPASGVTISRVVNGPTIIWKPERRGELCLYFVLFKSYEEPKLAFALTKYGKSTTGIHYECNKGIWNQITFARYDKLLEKMITRREFNLARIEKRLVVSHRYHPFGAMANIYVPTRHCDIFKVMDGQETIWECQNFEERCEYLVIHGDAGDPKLAEIFIRDDANYERVYYAKNGSLWNKVDKTEFYERLDVLDGITGTRL